MRVRESIQRSLFRRCSIVAAVALASALAVAGCDRPDHGPQASPPSATQPSAAAIIASATQPSLVLVPASQPSVIGLVSTISVNNTDFLFPNAQLRLTQDNGGVTAVLYSNDPKEAMDDNYKGNSYYMRMPLNATDPDDLSAATWTYKAPSEHEAADSAEGIFIFVNGQKYQLRPTDAQATFEGKSPHIVVYLQGQFRMAPTGEDISAEPKQVEVRARLEATVPAK